MNPHSPKAAFSLIEVVLALGIFSFSIVGILGLYVIGIRYSGDSEQHIQAADLVSIILSARRASPDSDPSGFTNMAIPVAALKKSFASAYPADQYVAEDGTLTTQNHAAYRLRCSAGTNGVTGGDTAMVYLLLSWPPNMDPANPAAQSYESISCIPLQ